jgi:geranylgeranyl pyrophosphate synthase
MTAPARKLEDLAPLVTLLDAEFERDHPSINGVPDRLWEASLHGPLRQFLAVPGKELRARFVIASYELAGGRGDTPLALPWLLEMLHAGSLIIDDIEDQSEMRRGQPALHRSHGVPLALNAGNWLYFWPLAQLERLGLPPEVELAMHRHMAAALLRCHRGQALDVTVRIGSLQQRDVGAVVAATTALKTGSLMELAAGLGALAAGASAERRQLLERFGRALGTGLQMLDDLGGVVSEARRDKGMEDVRQGRPTWPWAWLANELDELTFAKLQAQSRAAAHDEDAAEAVRAGLAASIDDCGRREVERHLRQALELLRPELGNHSAFRSLARDVARLSRSYG